MCVVLIMCVIMGVKMIMALYTAAVVMLWQNSFLMQRKIRVYIYCTLKYS